MFMTSTLDWLDVRRSVTERDRPVEEAGRGEPCVAAAADEGAKKA
jgi:hypothetical protein